jgi:hypothetical protein
MALTNITTLSWGPLWVHNHGLRGLPQMRD